MSVERKSFLASDGVEISYLDINNVPGVIPFLWIHGWGGDAERHIPILEGLSKFGFRCLCFDQRGCGLTTSMKNLGVPQSARDAKELLEHLGIDNAVVLGYSMGAAVLFSYLEQFGTLHCSRVIVGEMSPKPLNDDEWKLGLYQGWYTEENLREDVHNMEVDYQKFAIFFAEQTIFQHTPEESRDIEINEEYIKSVYDRAAKEGKSLLLDHFMIVPEANAQANRIYWESCDSHDYRAAFDRVDVPIGLFYARPGSIYRPEIALWIAERVPNATIYWFDDCTHMASGEKPVEFIQGIVEFAKKTS